MEKPYNYVYLIQNKTTNKKYIGSRGSTIEPCKDILKYQSSQIELKKEINENIENFKFEILSLHNTREEAYDEEMRLQILYDVVNSDDYYNKSIQSSNKFTTAGKTVGVTKGGKNIIVSTDDPRFVTGELTHVHAGKVMCYDNNNEIKLVSRVVFADNGYVGIAKGKVNVKDADGNNVFVECDDERIKSGELTYMFKDKVSVKDIDGNMYSVESDDPRYLSGELVGIAKGKTAVIDEDGKIKHVNTEDKHLYTTYASTMVHAADKDGNVYYISKDDQRYLSGEMVHFSKGTMLAKDKDGNKVRIKTDDPRYLSGELVGMAKGKIPVKDKDGNNYVVKKDDPRYLNGELVSIAKGLVSAKDKDGKIYKVSYDDPRYLSGELVAFSKGMVTVRDETGKCFNVDKDDPRYLSGELVSITKGMVVVKDKDGNTSCVKKDDPRYLSGELVSAATKYKVSIEGIIYPSISYASKVLQINKSTLKNRLNNKNFKDWLKIEF